MLGKDEIIKNLFLLKGISSYRVYTDLRINSGNYDSFIKGRDYGKIRLDKCREIVNYLERL